MTNSEQAIREIAEKWGFSQYKTDEGFLIDIDRTKQCLSDLTALISEHYVAKAAYIALENTLAKAEAKNLELLRQRDELREALQNLMDGVRGLPPLTAIVGVLEKQYKQAEAAIKKTER